MLTSAFRSSFWLARTALEWPRGFPTHAEAPFPTAPTPPAVSSACATSPEALVGRLGAVSPSGSRPAPQRRIGLGYPRSRLPFSHGPVGYWPHARGPTPVRSRPPRS